MEANKKITFGDIHGRSCWKSILFGSKNAFDNWKVNKELTRAIEDRKEGTFFGDLTDPIEEEAPISSYGKVIFVGDYVDTRDNISPVAILENLKDIILLKKSFPQKVVLLFGNHDWQYIADKNYSGRDESMAVAYKEIFRQNLDIFQIAYHEFISQRHVIWSHAGITKQWLLDYIEQYNPIAKRLGIFSDLTLNSKPDVIVEALNVGLQMMLNTFSLVGTSSGGYHSTGSCIWARPESYANNLLGNVLHVVGHTHVKSVEVVVGNSNNAAVMVDCLKKEAEVSTVEDCFVIDRILPEDIKKAMVSEGYKPKTNPNKALYWNQAFTVDDKRVIWYFRSGINETTLGYYPTDVEPVTLDDFYMQLSKELSKATKRILVLTNQDLTENILKELKENFSLDVYLVSSKKM